MMTTLKEVAHHTNIQTRIEAVHRRRHFKRSRNRYVVELPAVNHPDKTTVVGEKFTIPCHSSNSNPVNWWYQRNTDIPVTELVVNGQLINGHSGKFSLSTSNYDLTLLSAKWTDTGIYTCVEDTAFGTRHITRLTVTGMVKNQRRNVDDQLL